MKVTTPEYQVINRSLSYTGSTPPPDPKKWKKLGSKQLSIAVEGLNYVYVRVRDEQNLSSIENAFSQVNKLSPVRVRIDYNLNRH
jgi:hypothetical protein